MYSNSVHNIASAFRGPTQEQQNEHLHNLSYLVAYTSEVPGHIVAPPEPVFNQYASLMSEQGSEQADPQPTSDEFWTVDKTFHLTSCI
jgi:hypothetical protein